MKRKIYFSALLFLLLACASQENTPPPANVELNQIMTKMAGILTELFPKVLDKETFTRAVESGYVEKSVKQLTSHVEAATPHFANRSETYKISLMLIKQHLNETQRALKDKKLAHSRSRLMVLGEICASCHTQDTKLRTLFSGTKRSDFASDFAFAEYNYVTRNYPEALPYYEKHLKDNPGQHTTRALGRILAVHSQINGNPDQAIKHFKELQGLKLSAMHEKNIGEWISGLQSLKQDIAGHGKLNFTQLRSFVKRYLGNVEEETLNLAMDSKLIPARYWLRGQLFHYLNAQAKTEEVPELLYWLSACDRSLDYNLYYSLADLYLKDCMNNYSRHKVAKSCYREYQDYMEFSYSGSAGTHIPEHLKTELEKLRKRIWIDQ